jgi:DNA-binding PadR family transcriptional regulator
MESQGWLTAQIEPQEGKPSRKIYSITDKGMKVLTRWLVTEPEIAPERNPLLVKVFFGRMANAEALKKIITGYREYHTKLLEQYETETANVIQNYAEACSSPEDAAFWGLTLDFGQRYSKMVVEWCDHALKIINKNRELLINNEQKVSKAQGGIKHGTSRGIRKGKKTG